MALVSGNEVEQKVLSPGWAPRQPQVSTMIAAGKGRHVDFSILDETVR